MLGASLAAEPRWCACGDEGISARGKGLLFFVGDKLFNAKSMLGAMSPCRGSKGVARKGDNCLLLQLLKCYAAHICDLDVDEDINQAMQVPGAAKGSDDKRAVKPILPPNNVGAPSLCLRNALTCLRKYPHRLIIVPS